MNLFALSFALETGGQIALAALLGVAGFFLLLPNPRGRFVGPGIALLLSSLAIFGAWLYGHFGNPLPDIIGTILFALFSAGALGFGTVLVVQKNPARGAIAFAFVILSTCGLFLLLAAPFLMAATVIIYAGAIIVTFLFVLMLSNAKGPSDENDRSREPLLGSLAGLAFAGLVFLTLSLSAGRAATTSEKLLPAAAIRPEDKAELLAAAAELKEAADPATEKHRVGSLGYSAHTRLTAVVGAATGEFVQNSLGRTLQDRLRLAETDYRTAEIIRQADELKLLKKAASDALDNAILDPNPDVAPLRTKLTELREKTLLLAGRGELPARNVTAVGHALYSEYLIAVELAGTLLLVATIGAVAIANRKGVTA